ncbi:zinc finger protein 160 [Dunckerocampus dactyliophorus]|uniref:zinc finger protein 160 n=1 Tax=Dunckerocampus dactyliophorus TaxID=161453 RepID=UPI002406FB0A|nr:zinc finger protein 160 [Dunckerocampus dactyliophorus]
MHYSSGLKDYDEDAIINITVSTNVSISSLSCICLRNGAAMTEEDPDECKAKCWECGKQFQSLNNLMSHYTSHNITATCHICKVTFQRLTSLSLHLDNVHLPPVCRKCSHVFSSVWELNKHAESYCLSSNEQRADLDKSDMQPPERPETSGHSVEYTLDAWDLGRPIESDEVSTDESTSTASENEDNNNSAAFAKTTESYLNDAESDSSSTDSDSASLSITKPTLPSNEVSMCKDCGRGPFRSMKLHLLHCSGVRVKYRCSRCKAFFPTESSLSEHYIPLCSCDNCGRVFTHRDSRHQHPCPGGGSSRWIYFCSESMPKACAICKSFFVNEKSLLNHVTRVHTSVVSTKLCIITNPSGLTDKKVVPNVPSAITSSSESSLVSSSNAVCQNPHILKHVVNGKLCVGQTDASTTSHVASEQGSDIQPDPGILAVFENHSQEVALTQRMNKGWRSKAPHPCRQCGTILRQPYLAISHRYLHRGLRSHRCQCGRAFKHRLYLLRHCVQHAEAKSYICVNCGNTFTGAKHLEKHLTGQTWKKKHRTKCRMPFECGCGQLFYRPSAYIWHQLINNVESRHLKKRGK